MVNTVVFTYTFVDESISCTASADPQSYVAFVDKIIVLLILSTEAGITVKHVSS